ncbi:MAG: hypothetical protein ABSG78_18460 [Verrucomicrobiota bacterium]|jgi:hypothetical protein
MAPPASSPERATPPRWLAAGLLALVTVLIYVPAMRGGFIWDDDKLLTENPAVKTIDGLYAIWFGNWPEDYIPLTLSSFWLEWHLWGLHAGGYHIVNVLLHAANAVLLWRVLKCLGVPGSWLAALLFAAHPVCAASVTWIAERKNTLSMCFYLLSLGWFLRFDDLIHSPVQNGASRRFLGFALAAFFLALLAKSSVAVLPVVLLLFVWWRRGRVTRRDLDRCIPFFVLAVLMALVAVAVQSRAVQGGVGVIHDSLLVRLLGGARAVWFYLGKILLPTGLTMIYPRWEIDPRAAVSWAPAVLLAGLFFVFWRRRRSWGRPFLFALVYFVVALAPALGMVDIAFFSNSRVADHLQYLALPGIVALIAALARHKRLVAPALAAGMAAAVLAVLTCRHEKVLADGRTLWEDNYAKNPNSWKVCMNLSEVLLKEDKTEEAIKWKTRADALLQATAGKPK